MLSNFEEELNFAIKNSKEDDEKYIKSFSKTMKMTVYYIKRLIKEKFGDKLPNIDELIVLILENYSKISYELFNSTHVLEKTKKYIAEKHLATHRDVLANLLEKIETEKIDIEKICEEEILEDDFSQNVFLVACYLKRTYELLKKEMAEKKSWMNNEIIKLTEENGKDYAFVTMCKKYAGEGYLEYSAVKNFVVLMYYLIYGLEGREEKEDESKNSLAKKYIQKYVTRDYVDGDNYLAECSLKKELINSIRIRYKLLEKMGTINEAMEVHNSRMRRIRLPGLQYKTETIKNEPNQNNFKARTINSLMTEESLGNQDLLTLLQLNSSYNNRLAKILIRYTKMIFILNEIGGAEILLNNYEKGYEEIGLRIEDIGEEKVKKILEKYQILTFKIKRLFLTLETEFKKQRKQSMPFLENLEETIKTDFVESLKEDWGTEYEEYFFGGLMPDEDVIKEDVTFLDRLYATIDLTYYNKSESIKSEYAYWYYLMKNSLSVKGNFGIVLNRKYNEDTIFLASDSSREGISTKSYAKGIEFPNRVHIKKTDFVEFWKAYTGDSIIRVYDGFDDFIVDEEYVSTQIATPIDPHHIKYLTDLTKQMSIRPNYKKQIKRGKQQNTSNKNQDDSSRINYFNRNLVNHLLESFGVQESSKTAQYYDFNTGEIHAEYQRKNLNEQQDEEQIGVD